MAASVFISNNYINAVSGTAKAQSADIKTCVKTPIQDGLIINGVIMNDEALAGSLKNVWHDNPTLGSSASLVVSSSQVLSKRLTVPAAGDKKLIGIIKDEFSEVEDYNKLIYDYRTLKTKKKGGGVEILACGAEREFLESYVSLFEKAGIKLESINIALSAVINAVGLLPELSNKTYIIGNINGTNLSNLLFVNGEYYYSSRSRLLEELGTEDSATEISRLFMSLMQFNKSQKTGFDITDIYITGDLFDGMESFEKAVSESAGCNVSAMPKPSKVGMPSGAAFAESFFAIGNLI